MNDIPAHLFAEVVAAIEERLAIYDKYTCILDAQRVALKSGNLRLVGNLANRVDEILAQLQSNWERVKPVEPHLHDRTVNGQRAQTLRDRLTEVSARAATAHAGVRDLTAQLAAQRLELAAEIESHLGPTPQKSDRHRARYSGLVAPSLIDATG